MTTLVHAKALVFPPVVYYLALTGFGRLPPLPSVVFGLLSEVVCFVAAHVLLT